MPIAFSVGGVDADWNGGVVICPRSNTGEFRSISKIGGWTHGINMSSGSGEGVPSPDTFARAGWGLSSPRGLLILEDVHLLIPSLAPFHSCIPPRPTQDCCSVPSASTDSLHHPPPSPSLPFPGLTPPPGRLPARHPPPAQGGLPLRPFLPPLPPPPLGRPRRPLSLPRRPAASARAAAARRAAARAPAARGRRGRGA